MFGTDEFGNTRLLPFSFAIVFAVLAIGMIVTSQTIWGSHDTAVIGAFFEGAGQAIGL